MKRFIIVTLLCVNLALLAALVFGVGSPRAEAQVAGGGTDYVAMTGSIGTNTDVLWVIDLGRRQLAGFRIDRTTKRLAPVGGLNLRTEFGREAERY